MPGRERKFQVIGKLVHEDAIALDDGRLHRAGRDDVPIGQGRSHGKDRDQHDHKRADLFATEFTQPGAGESLGRGSADASVVVSGLAGSSKTGRTGVFSIGLGVAMLLLRIIGRKVADEQVRDITNRQNRTFADFDKLSRGAV